MKVHELDIHVRGERVFAAVMTEDAEGYSWGVYCLTDAVWLPLGDGRERLRFDSSTAAAEWWDEANRSGSRI